MRPDHQRIAKLEYELGFTDRKPSLSGTDAPGSVIYYDPTSTAVGPTEQDLRDSAELAERFGWP